MTRAAPAPDADALRRTARGLLVLGLLVCVPRLVLVLFARPVVDLLQIAATLLFVAGLLVIAFSVFRYRAIGQRSVLPVGIAGAVAVAVAAVVVLLFPPGQAQIAYSGGVFSPPAAIAYQYLYVALGALSQLGLMLVVGSIGITITERRTRRAR